MAQTRTVGELVQVLESRAPAGTAESWDNVGLLAGDPKWRTAGAVVSIDLTPQAIETAVRKGFKLIINHHPAIFPKQKGLASITANGRGTTPLIFECLRKGIAVFATHTNFDQCALEVPEQVAKGLECTPKGRLHDKPVGNLLKLVTFVPATHADAVRDAVCAAGAGQIGNYDSCTFSSPGNGTFRGGADTDPFLGNPGELETAHEQRLETILPRGLQKPVVQALLAAHPYEEVAFDLYPVEQPIPGKGLVSGLGYGFWGELDRPKSLAEVTRSVRRVFDVKGFWLTEPAFKRETKKIRRIAFVAGKGASFIGAAAAAGCDLFITGEAGYHAALDGSRSGLTVLELGHRESEKFFLSTISGWIAAEGLRAAALNLATQSIQTGDSK